MKQGVVLRGSKTTGTNLHHRNLIHFGIIMIVGDALGIDRRSYAQQQSQYVYYFSHNYDVYYWLYGFNPDSLHLPKAPSMISALVFVR